MTAVCITGSYCAVHWVSELFCIQLCIIQEQTVTSVTNTQDMQTVELSLLIKTQTVETVPDLMNVLKFMKRKL